MASLKKLVNHKGSLLLLIPLVLTAFTAWGQEMPLLPNITIGVGQTDKPQQVSMLLQILFLLTVLSLAPAIVVMMTSFTRLAIVFSLIRSASEINTGG